MAPKLGKLLLVDESMGGREELGESLRNLGWTVERATSRKAGIDDAMKMQPDVVITDILLSDVQGLAYARALRTCVEHDALIIGLTSDQQAVEAQARAAGFDGVLADSTDAIMLQTFMLSRFVPSPADAAEARRTTKMHKIK